MNWSEGDIPTIREFTQGEWDSSKDIFGLKNLEVLKKGTEVQIEDIKKKFNFEILEYMG